jgi:nucleotide-binding universal stress UspA family protein
MPLQQIVVPVDFSERCRGAALYAEALQKHFDAQITLLHVLPPPHYEFGAMEVGGSVLEDLFRARAEQARADLDAFLADELPAATTRRLVTEGDPAARILGVAHEQEAALVVMGTHGHGTFRRFILGSVTAKILHDADCPVWTGVHLVEKRCVDEIRFTHVAAAIDLRDQSERTLMWASRFAARVGAKLTILHATPDLEGRAGDYFDPDWRKHIEAQVRDEVARLQARLGTDAPVVIDCGAIPETVCSLAASAGADVLVIGRGSSAGVFGRLQANAYSIIRQACCPVVSV